MDLEQMPMKITPFHIALGVVAVLSLLVVIAINQLFQPLQTTTTTTTSTTHTSTTSSSTTTLSSTTTTTTVAGNPLLQKPSDGLQTPPTLPESTPSLPS